MHKMSSLPLHLKKSFYQWLTLSGVLFIITLCFLIGISLYLKHRIQSLEPSLSQLEEKTALLHKMHQENHLTNKEHETIQSKLTKLKKSNFLSPLHSLSLLSETLPAEIRIENFSFQHTKPLLLQARSQSSLPIKKFTTSLKTNFKNIHFESYQAFSNKQKEFILFSLQLS